jgi:hypothetical protein
MTWIARKLIVGSMLVMLFGCCPNSGTDDQAFEPTTPAAVEVPEFKLPDNADYWDDIGTYFIKSDRQNVQLRLYVQDSDITAEKMIKKYGSTSTWYPNSFALHAFYISGSGEWEHKKLFSCARVRFLRVGEVTPEKIELIFRSNFMIWIEPGEKIPPDTNKSFSQILSIKDGVPEVE